MPCLFQARIYLNKACRVRTLLVLGRVLPLLHTNVPPPDNSPGPRTLSPAPTVLPAAPVGPPWHTTCALLQYLCSRPRLHRAPLPDAAARLHFPASRLFGSTLLLVPDRRQRQNRAHT